MRKNFYLLVLSALFVGCSSDGSREIQIDEVEFIPYFNHQKIENCKIASSIFEVVPGKYELAWKLCTEAPQIKNFNVSLKLKLRLKKSIDIKDSLLIWLNNHTDEEKEIMVKELFSILLYSYRELPVNEVQIKFLF